MSGIEPPRPPELPAATQETPSADLEDRVKELSALTGGLAHEIRNPLSTMRVNLQLLDEDWKQVEEPDTRRPPDPHDVARRSRHRIATLLRETVSLDRILTNFMQYVGQRELNKSVCDVGELIRDAADFYGPQATAAGVELRVQCDGTQPNASATPTDRVSTQCNNDPASDDQASTQCGDAPASNDSASAPHDSVPSPGSVAATQPDIASTPGSIASTQCGDKPEHGGDAMSARNDKSQANRDAAQTCGSTPPPIENSATPIDAAASRTDGTSLHGDDASSPSDSPALLCNMDRNLMKQAILNLLINAQQAMPDGGEIYLLAAAHGEDELRIDVIDTGPGIPAEIRERIFTAYFSTKKGGTGLGLATTRRIVREHGGRIHLYSDPPNGSCFTIVLPREREGLSPERRDLSPEA